MILPTDSSAGFFFFHQNHAPFCPKALRQWARGGRYSLERPRARRRLSVRFDGSPSECRVPSRPKKNFFIYLLVTVFRKEVRSPHENRAGITEETEKQVVVRKSFRWTSGQRRCRNPWVVCSLILGVPGRSLVLISRWNAPDSEALWYQKNQMRFSPKGHVPTVMGSARLG